MSGLDNMKKRLEYAGGSQPVERMKQAKLQSLRKALNYSYEAATIIMPDAREFKCLINPDKIKDSYDQKIISIPFEDICLNSDMIPGNKTIDGIEEIGLKCGDVITWKETNTDWLVFLQRLEEVAYFRADIRKCEHIAEVGNLSYKVYAAKNANDNIDWNKNTKREFNSLDYQMTMYITRDRVTEKELHRFTIIKIDGKNWEVQSVSLNMEGIIAVALKEYFSTEIEENIHKEESKEKKKVVKIIKKDSAAYIKGDQLVYPYDEKVYTIVNAEGGSWAIDGSQKIKITKQDDKQVEIMINTSYSGNFTLKYTRENQEDILLKIEIDSL